MSFLVAIEGADGAGKATAAANVKNALTAMGHSAAVISFPRYRETAGGVALGEFLSGRTPVPVTPQAAAVLYAMDRMESVAFVERTAAIHDIVIFDRYIASNMVYQASKVDPSEAGPLMDWILRLETHTFGVRPPDISVYLDTPLDVARRLMLLKAQRSYTERQYDEHEADLRLQQTVRSNYAKVAAAGTGGLWRVVKTAEHGSLRAPDDIASEIVDHVLEALAGADRASAATVRSIA